MPRVKTVNMHPCGMYTHVYAPMYIHPCVRAPIYHHAPCTHRTCHQEASGTLHRMSVLAVFGGLLANLGVPEHKGMPDTKIGQGATMP